jgi:hypothetical protein
MCLTETRFLDLRMPVRLALHILLLCLLVLEYKRFEYRYVLLTIGHLHPLTLLDLWLVLDLHWVLESLADGHLVWGLDGEHRVLEDSLAVAID